MSAGSDGEGGQLQLIDVPVGGLELERFAEVLPPAELDAALAVAASIRDRLGGRVVWNVNSTAVGGGVAEMLRPLLAYTRGAGIDTRWLVIRGNADFFGLTKRLHHALHGSSGDGSPLGDREREVYEATLRENAIDLCARVQPRDVVLLHDPQTAGLAPHLQRLGAQVIWRCHIGNDEPSPEAELGWSFLAPYLDSVSALVFSRRAYVPRVLDADRSAIIPPSIDPFSAKNQELDPAAVRHILVHVGLIEGPPPSTGSPGFVREDGSPGRVERQADVIRLGRAPDAGTPLVVQVSRWDPLKDPVGVMHGFADLVDGGTPGDAELVLAGPNVNAVADDPEGARVFNDVLSDWRALPQGMRRRIHLASLPCADVEENAAVVNALQRHATVIVQKSLHEGFGLTVTEGMWKARALVASGVGGIRDQIDHGKHGLLLEDPSDRAEFAGALRRVLEDPSLAESLGQAARERVRERYLGLRHLAAYAELLERIDVG